jgi:quercetin dioxygenase-like cupin family protein
VSPEPSFAPRVQGPHPHRLVTGHDGDAHAVVKTDHTVEADPRLPGYDAKVVWCTSQFPPSNDEETLDNAAPCQKGGRVLLRVAEFNPGEFNHPNMHRTETQDIAVVLSGELEMVLDGGEVVAQLKSGDVVVQRGTMHAWRARGDVPVRVLFVLMDAQPVRVGDTWLREDLSAFEGKLSPMPTTDGSGQRR